MLRRRTASWGLADLFSGVPGDALNVLGVIHEDSHALKFSIRLDCKK